MLTVAQLQTCVTKIRRCHSDREVVIAGGALRDIICGKPIKDIDIFIQGTMPDHYCSGLHYRLEEDFALGTHDSDYEIFAASPLSTYGGYSDFWTIEYPVGWFGLPVQLVYVDTQDLRADLMECFDFGLSRIWCDERRLRWTSEFEFDRANKRLSFYGSGWGQTSPERLARIQAKYSDYRFRNLAPKETDEIKPIELKHA
jgi:hypothetical protein